MPTTPVADSMGSPVLERNGHEYTTADNNAHRQSSGTVDVVTLGPVENAINETPAEASQDTTGQPDFPAEVIGDQSKTQRGRRKKGSNKKQGRRVTTTRPVRKNRDNNEKKDE